MTTTLAQTREESRLLNDTLFEKLGSTDAGMQKEAVDAVNDFTRTKMREDGFYRRIIPPLQVSNSDLTRQLNSDKPVIIVDKEMDSPAAISIGFATLPNNLYIKGNRYPVMFDRIVTPRFTKDVSELRTWIMDIRQVLSDNSIKDMLAEEDSKFIAAVNAAIGGAPNAVVPTSNVIQWEQIAGGITRDSWFDMLKIVPNTPSRLQTHTILLNHITINDICKFTRNEMGGDMSQDIMKNGWTSTTFAGKELIITIKTNLVPTGSAFLFADPKFIGKNYILEDTTMYIKRTAYMIEFFSYEEIGGTIGHTSGLGRADFQ